MQDVSLAFFWHQHQPYYPDDLSGENPMPWVRLHGTKDYWGMAMLLDEVPEVHATINLVPSLLVQLQQYTDGGRQDRHLRVSRLPPDGFEEDDLVYLLDNFFMVFPDHMIRPYPRYHELYQKRGVGVNTALQAAKRFNKRDILDLQCWSNLTWMSPLAFERDKDLAEFRKKGRRWTQDEKQWLLTRQMELLAEVIPLHRRLQERGQVELTTTPFFHPILPLLWDKRLAQRALPDVGLPKALTSYPEDVSGHIQKAVDYHKRVFGRKPRGMWPSEGSVCQGIIPAIAEAGIEWIATDEEILSCSTDGWVSRDSNGYLRNPEMLYRPWRVEERGQSLQMVFRDHAMSDQIGFHYQRFPAGHAVDDFFAKVHAIAGATRGNAGQRPTLLSIILDGENCWEYYPNGGVDFLRALYRRVVSQPKVTPVRICDYLDQHPATDKLGNLFPGSWIQHNFGIWIGHPECNRAWDLLDQTRTHLVQMAETGRIPRDRLDRAWEELGIAEGSDWFWWFGDSHSSAQDSLFDRLFRKHLQNVYAALGEEPPGELARSISQGHGQRLHSQPTGLLNVKVDGRRTYFEWLNAGHYVCQGSRGTMSMAGAEGIISDMFFGFDEKQLALRLDTRGGPFQERLGAIGTIRVAFYEPEGYELRIANPSGKKPDCSLLHGGKKVAQAEVQAASDLVFEATISFSSLGVEAGGAIQFFIELQEQGQVVERIPTEGAIETAAPGEDFELRNWQA
jgi:alpha-amylase/alpha-mannosidase (GH57 family)